MTGQMRTFLDQTGGLWMKGALVGKLGSVFTSSATQHGGQESTILSFHITLLHQGMLIVGLPYSEQRQMGLDEIKGGSPYGASTIAGGQGERQPSAQELRWRASRADMWPRWRRCPRRRRPEPSACGRPPDRATAFLPCGARC